MFNFKFTDALPQVLQGAPEPSLEFSDNSTSLLGGETGGPVPQSLSTLAPGPLEGEAFEFAPLRAEASLAMSSGPSSDAGRSLSPLEGSLTNYEIPSFDMGRVDGTYFGLSRTELVETMIIAAASFSEFASIVDNFNSTNVLTPTDINFVSPNDKKFDLQPDGTFNGTPSGLLPKFVAFLLGTSVKKSAQASAFMSDDGKMYISFRGTDFEAEAQQADIASYAAILGRGKNYLESFDPFLKALAEYAAENDVTDIVVTGISLGGAAVNTLSHFKDTMFGGAFSDAQFTAFSSPITMENTTNIGWQNDFVFNNIFGKEDFDARTNGIIFYDEAYAEEKENGGRTSHAFTDDTKVPAIPAGVVKIAESRFFDMMEKDSKVVIDSFGQIVDAAEVDFGKRAEDGPTFIIGEDRDDVLLGTLSTDMIEGRYGNDYIDSRGGGDVIYTGQGSDVVYSGGGDDFVFVEDQNNFVDAGDGDDVIVVAGKANGVAMVADVASLPDLTSLPETRYDSDDYDYSFSPLTVVEKSNDRSFKVTYSVTNNGHVDAENHGIVKFYAVNSAGRSVYLGQEKIKARSMQEGETDRETKSIKLSKDFAKQVVRDGDWELVAEMTGFAEGAFEFDTRSVSLNEVFRFGKADGFETEAPETEAGSFVNGIGFTNFVSMEETSKYVKLQTTLLNKTNSTEKVDIKYYWSFDDKFDAGHDVVLGTDYARLSSNRLNEESLKLSTDKLDALMVDALGNEFAGEFFDFGYIFATADVRGSSAPVTVSEANPINRELYHADQDQGGWNIVVTGEGGDTLIAQAGTKTVVADFDVESDTLVFDGDAEITIATTKQGVIVSGGDADLFLFGVSEADAAALNIAEPVYSDELEYLTGLEERNFQFESYAEVSRFIANVYDEIVELDRADFEQIFMGTHAELSEDGLLF